MNKNNSIMTDKSIIKGKINPAADNSCYGTLLPLGLSKYCFTTTIDTCVPDEASQSKSPKSEGNYRLTVNIPVCNC